MPAQEAGGATNRGVMRLAELWARAAEPTWPPLPTADSTIVIEQVTDDSRAVRRGACFVAIAGVRSDGARFVADAVARGAVAVVADRVCAVPSSVVFVRVPDARRALARLAAVHCGLADANWAVSAPRLRVIGVTGTNGKSTICYLTRAILRAAGLSTAQLGTIEYDLISRTIEAPMTTPPATDLCAYLAEAVEAGATHAVMEVSSHAMDQRRADGIRFDVGIFTNLTGDHMDYHEDREAYRRAKRRLFDGLEAGATAVVNVDDPAGESMLEACEAAVLRYGITRNADLTARDIRGDATGTRMQFVFNGTRMPVSLKLVGTHNVQNALAAAAAARAIGIEWPTIVAGLESVASVRGRLERVRPARGGESSCTVLVDYAHTDDALDNVLRALRPLAPKRLITLFGCGGDRDRTKRPRMAQIASQWADRIVVTSDNPRTEDPADIIEEILEGFSAAARDKVLVQSDRARAIREAILAAEPGDVVLLAGKGHETYQEIDGLRSHFDDAEVAAQVLADVAGVADCAGEVRRA